MKTKHALLKLLGSLFGLVLLATPSLGVALTITQVLVVVGGAQYCDTTTSCPNQIWNLGGGVTLNTGQNLILTQTGILAMRGGENFDTSDRGGNNLLVGCSTAGGTPCDVQISINSGSGLVQVVNDPSGNLNPLTAFNLDSSDVNNALLFQEPAPWVPAPDFTGAGYTLDLGYADNIHGGSCPATAAGCFPQEVWGAGGPTVSFKGVGIGAIGNCTINTFGGVVHPNTDGAGNVVGCYDGGALRITALAPPPPAQGCTPGFWKQSQHFDSWVGFTPGQKLSTVFTFPTQLASFGNETFLQALQGGGGTGLDGAVEILLRAAAAALLNANSVSFPLSKTTIISQVNMALASLDRDTILALASTLDSDNNLGCPLS